MVQIIVVKGEWAILVGISPHSLSVAQDIIGFQGNWMT